MELRLRARVRFRVRFKVRVEVKVKFGVWVKGNVFYEIFVYDWLKPEVSQKLHRYRLVVVVDIIY